MATMPKPRTKVSISAGETNRALRDIITPTKESYVESVEAVNYKTYNTKAVIMVDNWENGVNTTGTPERYTRRTVNYNRVDLAEIIPGDLQLIGEFETVLEVLNSAHRLDFTEDDIELVDGLIVAKPTSLGYIGSKPYIADEECNCFADAVGYNSNNSGWVIDDEQNQLSFKTTVTINGQKTESILTKADLESNQWYYYASSEISSALFAVPNIDSLISYSDSSNNGVSIFIQNLTAECLHFGLEVARVFANSEEVILSFPKVDLCAAGTGSATENDPYSMAVQNNPDLIITADAGTYTININGYKKEIIASDGQAYADIIAEAMMGSSVGIGTILRLEHEKDEGHKYSFVNRGNGPAHLVITYTHPTDATKNLVMLDQVFGTNYETLGFIDVLTPTSVA